ncbi:MAG: DEAD/DEAH box helicase [Methanobacteriota archaeon]|nr:MAG: DEAD/DEAH box helicase [Euryarchaeota archaeon]
MTINDLRATLASEERIEWDPFKILQQISIYVNDPENEGLGRELLLRALDKRECFSGYEDILNALVRQVGLFPYLEEDDLPFRDVVAYEFHKPEFSDDDMVFHRVQAEIYRRLMDGENVILSAPTSFGKSKIIDALIASQKFQNIAIIVPTIALIDETRKRLSIFKDRYKVVTQVSQECGARNIFVFTAERFNAYSEIPHIDFFVIDEFYKIGSLSEDETRTIALNQAFYNLWKGGGQFYLLGPNIKNVPPDLQSEYRCVFYQTDYSTVVSETIPVGDYSDDMERLISLAEDIDDQTLIYCQSPNRVNKVARSLMEAGVAGHGYRFDEVADWVSDNYHPEWVYQNALKSGIGIHHGKLPRSLAQYTVKSFNEGKIKFLICTSTLIEGVNTSAKNVIIFDKKVGPKAFDFFTFNNIRGRSGRMFRHFIGKVYLFHNPPHDELPFVDFPVLTQKEEVPESLLLQIDESDLKERSKERLMPILTQEILPLEIIRLNSGIDPESQINLARELMGMDRRKANLYFWKEIPAWESLKEACEMIWAHFVPHSKAGVYSGVHLAFKLMNLMHNSDYSNRIQEELFNGQYSAKSPDEAVERVLDFDRKWAGFEFPRLLMALSRIQDYVFHSRFGRAGDYSFFCSRTEALFRNPVAAALEEYGLPIQITDKICRQISLPDELDAALEAMKMVRPEEYGLSPFEAEMLLEAQKYL